MLEDTYNLPCLTNPASMKHRSFSTFIASLLCLFAGTVAAHAAEYYQTKSLAPAIERAEQYASQVGAERVLVVLDIDNTLLAMDSELGSDQWFNWQEYLQEHEPQSPHLVARDFPGLLEVQGLLFTAGHMHPPEQEMPAQLAKLQQQGIATMALTSRGDEYRAATTRELKRAGYDLAKSAPRIRLFDQQGPANYETCARFTPYYTDEPDKYGLTTGEVTAFHLSDHPRQVSYGDGVMMCSGQHKGAMMLVLLHLMEQQYDAVVFVDDTEKHVMRVYDALARRGVDVAAYHYTHEEGRVDRFTYGDKSSVTKQWQQILDIIGPFPEEQSPSETLPQEAAAAN